MKMKSLARIAAWTAVAAAIYAVLAYAFDFGVLVNLVCTGVALAGLKGAIAEAGDDERKRKNAAVEKAADTQIAKGRPLEAIRICEAQLSAVPNDPAQRELRLTLTIRLAKLSRDVGNFSKALDHYRQLLGMTRWFTGESRPLYVQAIAFRGLAEAHLGLGELPHAKEFFEKSIEHWDLSLHQADAGTFHIADQAEAFDLTTKAKILNQLSVVYQKLGDAAGAIALEDERLELLLASIDLLLESIDLEQQPAALDATEQLEVVKAFAAIGNPAGVAHAQRALALRIKNSGRDAPETAEAHDLLAVVWGDCGSPEMALHHALRAQAVLVARFGETSPELVHALIRLGAISAAQGDLAASLNYFERAEACAGERLDQLPEIRIGIAEAEIGLERLERVRARLLEAIPPLETDPDGNAALRSRAFSALSRLEHLTGTMDVAIFLGKKAVNILHGHLTGIYGDNPLLLRSMQARQRGIYQSLCEVLVLAGRLGEAQQVLALLKESELLDIVRRDAGAEARLSFAQLSSLEAEWQRHGDTLSLDIVRLGAEVVVLRQNPERNAQDDARLQSALAELDTAERAVRTWLAGLREELAAGASEPAHSAAVNFALLDSQQAELRALGTDVATVTYFVGKNRLSMVFTTAMLEVSRDVVISETAVNQLVHEFRFAIINGFEDDVLKLGQVLWGHLIGPIAPLLDDAGISTLTIVPDGALRYLPYAALHDGTRYLIERRAVAMRTLAAHTDLAARPAAEWSVAGLGVSRELTGYSRLAAVAEELHGIVKSDQGEGIYPGVIRLDDAFTEASFSQALLDHQVVHVASHFVLDPAQYLESFLLLGDGSRLTLDRLRDPSFVFHDVELIALSACETALGSRDAGGSEFEGFATLLQRRSAKAVIASLWLVADQSTAQLMTAFYRARQSGLSKAAALRAAQMALLGGENRKTASAYHWAAFVLMGNWL